MNTTPEPSICIVRTWSSLAGYQGIEYEGTREDLLAVRLAPPEMFDVGSSGKKSRTRVPGIKKTPTDQWCKVEKRANGRWRVSRIHEPGNPPYLPERAELPRAHRDYSHRPSIGPVSRNIIIFPDSETREARCVDRMVAREGLAGVSESVFRRLMHDTRLRMPDWRPGDVVPFPSR